MEEHPANRRYHFSIRQFSLRQLLLFVAICGLAIAGWIANHRTELDNCETTSITSSDHVWLITYGTKNSKLVFAVFAGEKQRPVHGPVNCRESRDNRSAVLLKPDGTEIPLNGQRQLFEIVDGKYQDSDQRVTVEQFNSFLDSHPDEYDIEHLLQFSKAPK